MAKPQITASVLPAGSDPVVGELPAGKHTLTIVSVRENNEMTVEYPDGWRRDHQAANVQALLPKITNNLRARFGVEAHSFTRLPDDIEEGEQIEVTVE